MAEAIVVDNILIFARSPGPVAALKALGVSFIDATVNITGKRLEDRLDVSAIHRSLLCFRCANLEIDAYVHNAHEYDWGFEAHLWVEDIRYLKPEPPWGEA